MQRGAVPPPRPRLRGASHPCRRALAQRALGLFIAAWVFLSSGLAGAAVPVIEPGRERDVLRLLEPYKLGGEVTPGWKLWNVRIQPSHIEVELNSTADPPERVVIKLDHHDLRPPGSFEETKNFRVSLPRPPPESARPATLAVAKALKQNDTQTFWRVTAQALRDTPESLGPRVWVRDGLLHFAALIGLIVGLFAAELWRTPRKLRVILVSVLALGAVLRLTLTERAALDAWPFSRVPFHLIEVFNAPVMARLSHEPRTFFLTDLIFDAGLIVGLLGPLVVCMHARRMLGSSLAGVIAGCLTALWPSHLRFSHSDGTFMASIVVSGLAFTLVYEALRHPKLGWRLAALLVLPVLVVECLDLRPLNQLFAGLLVIVALWLAPDVPKLRRASVIAAVVVPTLAISLPEFFRQYGSQITATVPPTLPLDAALATVSFKYNTLIRPEITPPVGFGLAVFGTIALWKRSRRVGLFLLGWLGVFFFTHSVILPPEPLMQARYHLHLIVPFILLASAGLAALLEAKPRWGQIAAAVLLFSPLIHLGFIRDVKLNEPTEHRFVHELRGDIPPGCKVIEYVGKRPRDSRIARVGLQLRGGNRSQRFEVLPVEIGADPSAALAQASRGSCARVYLGLECYVDGEPEAPACAELRRAASGTVRELEVENRIYDRNNVLANPNRKSFRLGLYELEPASSTAAQ